MAMDALHTFDSPMNGGNVPCTSQQIMDTKTKIIKHKKIDHRAPVVGA